MPELEIQPELLSLRGKLVDAIAADEKQVAVFTERVKKNRELLHAINGSLGILNKETTGYGAIADTVRSAVKSLEVNPFTSDDIKRQLNLLYPTASVSKSALRTAIWNLVKKKEIDQVRKGSNTVPAQYQKNIVRIKRTTDDSAQATLKIHTQANGSR